MADIWMDVDTALSEVPVNLMPLVSDSDFKTIDSDVDYNAAGLTLIWHFVTTAGAYSQTAVTPTNTGGNYDWVEQGNGMFTIEIPASGGASINNDTEGFGWFTGVATGILPWRGPVIGFRASGLNDLLIDSAYSTTRGLAGTALPNAAAEAAGGLFTRGTGAGQINQTVNGLANSNLINIAGAAVSTTTAQLGVNAVQVNGVATTSVTTVNANIGTTQPINFTGTGASALAKSDMVDIAGAAVSTTTAQVGANIVQVIGDPIQASSSKTTNWGGTP
jgi:hypothetical protein